MAAPLEITSPQQFTTLVNNTALVLVNFTSTTNESYQNINTAFNGFAQERIRPSFAFAVVDSSLEQITSAYRIDKLPTIIFFMDGRQMAKLSGDSLAAYPDTIQKLAAEFDQYVDKSEASWSESTDSENAPKVWLGAELPRGKADLTHLVEMRNLDLLNADSGFASVGALFGPSKPLTLAKAKEPVAPAQAATKDWVESDVDEQLLLYVPFQSLIKAHTIHLTSAPPSRDSDSDAPMRPKKVKIFVNETHNLDFEEAEERAGVQTMELQPSDWDSETATAKLELRFVKFQKVTSLVLFVASGDGDGERTRLDRVRILGDAGQMREMGKLEKIGDLKGE